MEAMSTVPDNHLERLTQTDYMRQLTSTLEDNNVVYDEEPGIYELL